MMLAHIVTTHDVKMEKEGVCPWSYHIRDTNIPVPMVGYNAVVWALYLAFVRGIQLDFKITHGYLCAYLQASKPDLDLMPKPGATGKPALTCV